MGEGPPLYSTQSNEVITMKAVNNVVGVAHIFKSPPLWGKASLNVVGKECLILHDRYHTAVVVYDNWTSLITELERFIAGRSKTEPVQVGPYLGNGELYLTSQQCPVTSDLGEGLILRMGEVAVLLTHGSVRLLLGLLHPTEDDECFPLDGTDNKED